MDESLKKYVEQLPGSKPVEQSKLNEHFKDVARSVVPDIERKEREQFRLNAEYSLRAGMKRVQGRG